MNVQLQVYKASPRDGQKVRRLYQEARRSFAAFGHEDLPQLLANGNCVVADDGERLWAFLGVTINRSQWAFLRGVAITDGWRTDDGLSAVLVPLSEGLRGHRVSHLAAYGTALWLVPALMRVGFQRLAWILTLERHPRPLAALPAIVPSLRPVGVHDLPWLTTLDQAAFDAPYQLASGELIELMVTSGFFSVAEAVHGDGGLAGYVCADVSGDEAQVIRLAVHPYSQRQGIGRALLNEALTYCQAQGARRVTINTQESNTASLQLYEQFGFRRVGRRVPLLVLSLA